MGKNFLADDGGANGADDGDGDDDNNDDDDDDSDGDGDDDDNDDDDDDDDAVTSLKVSEKKTSAVIYIQSHSSNFICPRPVDSSSGRGRERYGFPSIW